eukprot:maker-scaffold299_size217019-snap-gene-0.12 protein:Tk09191 transcript:maker-scaffold299_size217019-snap-gene-0.12-mRNA-1 annotation:"hypothetical protein DAPPUDRAFT_306180"
MPWCRIQPYLAGAILGYLLHRQRNKTIELNWVAVVMGWVLALGCLFAVVYGLDLPTVLETQIAPTKAVSISYGGLHRLVWGLGLAWIVWACAKGYGGWINTLLSWEAFMPLGRVTYVMYLTHDMVVSVYGGNYLHIIPFSHFLAETVEKCGEESLKRDQECGPTMEKCDAILRLHNEGKSCRYIDKALRALNASKSTVSYTIQRFKRTNTLQNLPKSGRPRSVWIATLVKATQMKIARNNKRPLRGWPSKPECRGHL